MMLVPPEFSQAFSSENLSKTHSNAVLWQDLIYENPLTFSSKLIIDLRSEKEFESGHVPGSVNIPLLSNSERHEVGLCYKTNGKNKAIILGLAYFKEKAESFLKTIEKTLQEQKPQEFQIYLYCARGGMRSSLTTSYLKSQGFKASLIKGGYKAYRKLVCEEIHQNLPQKAFLVLHGHTGCGKTETLRSVDWQSFNVAFLDFEKLAKHSGSAFGDFNQNEKSVSQMQFENELFTDFLRQKEAPCFLVEIESSLGKIHLSANLRQALTEAPMIVLTKDFEARVQDLTKDYTSSWDKEKEELFLKRFEFIREKFSRDNTLKILDYAKSHDFKPLIEILLIHHYDPQYSKSLRRHSSKILDSFCCVTEKKELINYIKHYVHQKNFDSFDRTLPSKRVS